MIKKASPLILSVVITLLISTIHLSVLTIREQRTGELIWNSSLKNNTFSIQWMHSVELEQWRETFQITDLGKVELIETRFKAWGAGVPENEGHVFYEDGEWFVMQGFDGRTFDELPIGVSCYAEHRLLYDSKTYNLCDWVADGTSVVIKKESLSIFQILLWKF